MKRVIIPAVLPIVAVLLAGCGSSSNSSSTPAPATPPTQSSSTPAATSSTPATTASVLVVTKHNKLGTVLAAGPKKLTVYLFEADTGSKSTCTTAACTKVWPPLITTAQAQTGGQAMAADLGTIKRSDGTTQVTYKGHPLYYYAKDGDSGDAYGAGIKSFGAKWYVLAPSGKKIDNS